jgi:hypothetical protein
MSFPSTKAEEFKLVEAMWVLRQMIECGDVDTDDGERLMRALEEALRRLRCPPQPGVPPATGFERHMMFVD